MAATRLTPHLAQIVRDRAFRNSLGEGAYLLDEEGRLLELNSAGEQMLGWTAGELCGRDMHQAVHYLYPDGRPFPRDQCPLLRVLRSGDEFAETNDTFVRKDGTLVAVSYVSSPIIVANEVVGAVLAFWSR